MQKFRADSQHWFQNNFRNHDWMICHARIWTNVFYRKWRNFWNPVTPRFQISVLEFGIGPSYFWSLSQVWFQNSFQNHDPTICFLRKKENIFYRKWLFCYISLALPWTPGTPLMSHLTALDPLDFPRPLGHPLIISKWSVRTSSGVGGVSWQNIHVVTVYLCQRGPCQTPSWGTGQADE